LIAIGGIDGARIRGVLDAGAHGVAVIRAVWNADDPADAVRRLSTLLSKVAESGDGARKTRTVKR
jgi:thiamine-phosphate pyrophosphorylase